MTLKSFQLVQVVQGITRIAKRGKSISQTTIDVKFTNCYSDFHSCDVLDERIGDHQAILCKLNNPVPVFDKYQHTKIRDFSLSNISTYMNYLNRGSDYSALLACDNVDTVADALNNHIIARFDEFFPYKVIKRHPKFIHKPSKEFLEARKLRQNLYSVFKKAIKQRNNRTPSCKQCNVCPLCIKCNKAWEMYKKQRNCTNTLAKHCKKANVITDLKAKSAKNDLKGVWRTIKLDSI